MTRWQWRSSEPIFELKTFELKTFELKTFELKTFELKTSSADDLGEQPPHFFLRLLQF